MIDVDFQATSASLCGDGYTFRRLYGSRGTAKCPNRGCSRQAARLLENVYSWVTEGYGTPDLKDARQLLEALT